MNSEDRTEGQPQAATSAVVLRRWYFSVEDWDDNEEFIGPDGESIGEEEAKRHPFIGDRWQAGEEGDRRSSRWEDREDALAARVTSHSMGKAENDQVQELSGGK